MNRKKIEKLAELYARLTDIGIMVAALNPNKKVEWSLFGVDSEDAEVGSLSVHPILARDVLIACREEVTTEITKLGGSV